MISVIMPVYDGEKYIEQAIESVILQTYRNWELIIINDGSTDNTEKKILNYSDNRIRYYYQENKGPSFARNFGMSVSKGNYIALIDADDIYDKNKLRIQLDYLEENSDVDVVYNAVPMIDENSKYISTLKAEIIPETKEDFLAILLFRQIIPIPPSIIFRKKCYDFGCMYNENIVHSEDYDFIINLAKKHRFAYIDKELYYYRRHNNNLSNDREKNLKNEITIIKNIGKSEIERIVNESNFSSKEKNMLLGKIFYKIEDYDNAEQIFLNLAKQYDDEYILFYLGNIFYLKNEFNNAIEYFKKAINLNSNCAELFNNLGCAFAKTNMMQESMLCFEKAILLNKDYMDANINLNEIKNCSCDFKLTKRELRKNLLRYF